MIQGHYKQWQALRAATEVCAQNQGGSLVAAMAELEVLIAAAPGRALSDVIIKLELAMAGVDGMLSSAYADMAPWVAQAAE